MTSAPLQRWVRRGPVLMLSALVMMGLALAACGGTAFVFAGDASDNVFLKVPGSWTRYDMPQMLKALRVQDTPAGGGYSWIVGFDAAPDPSVHHVLLDTDLPHHPVVQAYVKKLSANARDQFSLQALRNDRFPVDQSVSQGHGDFLGQKDITLAGGIYGEQNVYDIKLSDGRALQVNQIGLVNPGVQRMYMLLIYCDATCYQQNRNMIDEVARSWTVKEP